MKSRGCRGKRVSPGKRVLVREDSSWWLMVGIGYVIGDGSVGGGLCHVGGSGRVRTGGERSCWRDIVCVVEGDGSNVGRRRRMMRGRYVSCCFE